MTLGQFSFADQEATMTKVSLVGTRALVSQTEMNDRGEVKDISARRAGRLPLLTDLPAVREAISIRNAAL
jgi:hypothetical protein